MSVRRVLFVTDSLEVGGVERLVVGLANAMSEKGLGVGVAALEGGSLWSEVSGSVEQYPAPARSSLRSRIRYLLWIRRTAVDGRFDVLHGHQRGVSLMARIAVLGTRIRVVEHVHSKFSPSGILSTLSFRGHVLIACGTRVADMLIDDFKRPRDRVVTVLNAIEDVRHGDSLALPMSAGSTPKVLGVGRLWEAKDPLRFARALDAASASGYLLTGEWVGDGPLKPEIEAYARSTSSCVAFTGHSNEVRKKILDSDLILLSSRWEGLPLVILEAMSLGRAVIAPAVGSCGDIVKSGVNGILYDPALSDDVLAETVGRSLTLESLSAWGANARSTFEDWGDFDSMADRVREAYGRV